ncbi:unnamed protein product [Notodromas monacha]|uniref:Uncharacterized protein n=1 Tax=Notodromas monacha TaxID=399045 RepID=A0A7R9BVX7_9CRUS|nr:unnamed protein product [Notodromas monacha]CAG0922379.1 unnamed protein product [Notodromas monacha]
MNDLHSSSYTIFLPSKRMSPTEHVFDLGERFALIEITELHNVMAVELLDRVRKIATKRGVV